MGLLVGTIGQACVRALLLAGIVAAGVHVAAYRQPTSRWQWLSRTAMLVQFAMATAASASLVWLLVTENTSYAYVAEYTGAGLPLIYRIAAFWGGNAGSLLLWVLILTMYGAVAAYSRPQGPRRMLPLVALCMTLVGVFFSLLLNLQADPFQRLPRPAPVGNGLSPLLQNPGMTVHPIDVYLGFIGFTVPFSYAMAGFVLRTSDAVWLPVTRRWTLVSWLFLSIGIVYGAHWSYEELGWGGYWAWDPVENASLLPWLTATAFLHSAMAQERRGMFKRWNAILVTLTFLLTIFGTFLTRSGAVWSIHAFANSGLGPYYLAFLGVAAACAAAAILRAWPSLAPDVRVEAAISRETGFMLNNLLLLACMFAVLWGTVFPILTEMATGHAMTLSAAFYNDVNLPLAVSLLVLMAVGPWLVWRKPMGPDAVRALACAFLAALVFGIGTAAVLHRAYGRQSALACCGLIAASFALFATCLEVARSVKLRAQAADEPWWMALWRWVGQRRRRIGGYIVHAGFAVCAMGVAASGAYHLDVQKVVAPGGQIRIGAYDLTFLGLGVTPGTQKRQLYATLVVRQHGQTLGILQPSATFYRDGESPNTSVALYSRAFEDLYVVLLGTGDKGSAVLDVHLNPWVAWIWFGGDLFIVGAFVSLWPERARRQAVRVTTALRPVSAEAAAGWVPVAGGLQSDAQGGTGR